MNSPISILWRQRGGSHGMVLVVTGTGSDCKLVNNGGHSVDAVMATVWSELNHISSLKDEQRPALKAVLDSWPALAKAQFNTRRLCHKYLKCSIWCVTLYTFIIWFVYKFIFYLNQVPNVLFPVSLKVFQKIVCLFLLLIWKLLYIDYVITKD